MTLTPHLLAGLAGLALSGGTALAFAGCRASAPHPPAPRWSTTAAMLRRAPVARLAAGTVAGALLWLATGWILAVVLLPAALLGVPGLLGGARQAGEHIARLEAVEEWVRSLASRLSAGITLEQALIVGAATAPQRIAGQVQHLAALLRQGQPPPQALRRFAEELAGAASDQVVTHLILAYERRGPGAAAALTQMADWVASEVEDLRQIEAERAGPRFTARTVTLIALLAVAALSFTAEYMAPYATPSGQLTLAAILAVFTAALMWMRRITALGAEARLLHPAPAPAVNGGGR